MARHIQAPGVEINEFDRSQYGQKIDNSLPNAPVVLVTGFADKGEDYTIQWVNSKTTLEQYYGYPTNEPEKYLYNACLEVLNRGGYCIVAKLPYFNNAKDKYNYTTYEVDTSRSSIIDNTYSILNRTSSNNKSLYDIIFNPDIQVISNLSVLNEQQDSKINLEILQELIEYIDQRCSFSFDAKRTFNYIFYSNASTLNYSSRLLSSIFSYPQLDDIYKNIGLTISGEVKQLISCYQDQISSIHNSLNSVEGIQYYNDYIKEYIKTQPLSYFEEYVTDLSAKIVDYKPATDRQTNSRNALLTYLNSIDFTNIQQNSKYQYIRNIDDSIKSFYEIKSSDLSNSTMMSFDQFDDLKTGITKPKNGQFYIVDITRSQYNDIDILNGTGVNKITYEDKDCLGIFPVVTTPMNAMYFQQLIDISNVQISAFNPLLNFQTTDSDSAIVIGKTIQIDPQNFATPLSSSTIGEQSISEVAAGRFPTIAIKNDGRFERDYLKQIGIVVFKAYKDYANNEKINFKVLESFVGSLDKNATDINTHENIFIGNRINTYSQTINFFSGVQIDDKNDSFDTYLIQNQTATSLGFYEIDCDKNISTTESISKPLDIILEHAKNSYSMPLDIVLDAGVSNIAQFIKTMYWKTGYGLYDFDSQLSMSPFANVTANNSSTWKLILNKYDNFCKNMRMNKDCMCIVDGLRHFCLIGNEKKIRRTCHTSNFIDNIYPGLKYMNALDSSYAAGYCDWFYGPDAYSTDLFWIPPSIKAVGSYIYSDTYFKPWSAPAGLTRGIMSNTYDLAFNPTNDEAGKLYNQQWNYAISYPIDGIILEGQRTFQKNKSALDRVNVRRLLLYLEKEVVRIGRQFIYEQNTEYLRERFVDQLTTLFEDCKNGDGIKDYAIKCDEENNTDETIEQHELHVRIGLIPIKTLEFLVCDFIVGRQSSSVTELVSNNT